MERTWKDHSFLGMALHNFFQRLKSCGRRFSFCQPDKQRNEQLINLPLPQVMEHEGILGHLWTSNSCTIRTTFDRTIGLTIIEKPFTAKWLQASLWNSNNELVTWRITTWIALSRPSDCNWPTHCGKKQALVLQSCCQCRIYQDSKKIQNSKRILVLDFGISGPLCGTSNQQEDSLKAPHLLSTLQRSHIRGFITSRFERVYSIILQPLTQLG